MTAPLALTIFDALVFLAVVVPFVMLVRHRHAIPLLPPLAHHAPTPRLSVVVPARDEAAAIERAVGSLLAQDYPDLEVIAVDDRSSDATGEVLRGLAARDARLVTLRIDELPAGWLGKNHALWRGAARARGEWLLFTDADVVFAPGALRRAVAYAVGDELDHLTLAPRLVARGVLLRAFVAFFAFAFVTLWGAYLANDPKSARGVGIGAFNLLRRTAYERIGTMRAISLRPDDDIRLGRRLRGFGFRQRVLNGRELIAVEWYPTLGAALAGLEKSMYSSLEYRVVDAVAVLFFLVATMVWPYVGALALAGLDRALLVIVVACLVAGIGETYRQSTGPITRETIPLIALLPVSALCFGYAIARSVYLAETRGVRWRGTTYPLSLLRAQSGLEGTAANRSR
ncbi:MAG TPA: glycosyltransferase [Candidatus Limnocylindria bacterium]|jgi:glycosyltransferase involved in cell wall biosynthesis|nr:glycosyltransferase [Candidatus Limnocylindria bacterium]